LITFARFLGSFSEYGWSWNQAPTGQCPSAEMVESALVFLYGITNTWMERFGANHGDPYTTKQVQHISIAVRSIHLSCSPSGNLVSVQVMFWFSGLIGMGIESKRVRRWLASVSAMALKPSTLSREPPSYSASFNPFPALVIGVTGATMAAHAQTYLFQVRHAIPCFVLKIISPLAGSNTCSVGQHAPCFLCLTMPDVFFPLARPSSVRLSFASTDRGSRQLFPRLRWSDLHA
jgi:hypothetical protein